MLPADSDFGRGFDSRRLHQPSLNNGFPIFAINPESRRHGRFPVV
jgi:hypothetical protein